MAETKKESGIVYDETITTYEETIENPIDISLIPVIKIENCEVFFSSITSKSPQYGHGIEFLLPTDNIFLEKDKIIRQKYTLARQGDGDAGVENYKGAIKFISKKIALEKKFYANHENRNVMNIKISNTKMYDMDTGEKIDKVKDAEKGNVKVKYYRVLDKYTGKGIEPKVFKYVNGEKTFGFMSPKQNAEIPYYLNKGDIVNVQVRPYETEFKGDYFLKYNILSIEIVQSAFDRGIKKTGGGGKPRVVESADTVSASSFANIFGTAEMVTGTPDTKPEVKVAPEPDVKKVEVKAEPVVTKEPTPVNPLTLDFSMLENMNVDTSKLGD